MYYEDEDSSQNYDQDYLAMFGEEDTVIIDKGHLSEQRATILYYNGDGYFKVMISGDETDVHVFRLTKN